MVARAASALALLAVAASESLPEGIRLGVRFDNATDLQLRLAENQELLKQHLLRNATSNGCDRGLLNVPICYQVCDEWCWATVTSMVVDYYKGQNVCENLECQVASREFGQQCCPWSNSCQNSPTDPPSACNSGGSTQQIADAASAFVGGPFQIYGTLDQATLDAALSSNRPVIILVSWQGGGGHALIVAGCGGGTYSLHDPWGWYRNAPPQWQSLSYAQLLQYPAPDGGIGTWGYTVTWALSDEAGHAKALLAANEARARSRSAEIAV